MSAALPFLVRNALQAARRGQHPVRVDVLIEGGRIADIRDSTDSPWSKAGEDLPRIDASSLVLLPGLINAHVHSNEAFERGLYPSLPLERWLTRTYPPLGAPELPARWHYLRAMLVACDAIRSGTVALQDDFLNPGCDADALEQVIHAWSDSGLRARVATTLSDRPYLDGLPAARTLCDPSLANMIEARAGLPLAGQVAFFKQAHRTWHASASGRLGIMLGPRGPQRCSDGLLAEVARLSSDHDCAVHMHVLETRTQLAVSRRQPGGGFLARLKSAGLLNDRMTINHAVWVDDSDIRAMAEHGVCVTHNPLSNQRLGSGTAPVPRMRAAGISVALGSDGPATGDTACMSAVIRAATLLHRGPDARSEDWLTPDDAWQMATRAGASSMRLEPAWGRLEPGAPADFILLNARHRSLIPHHDTVAQWALSASPDVVDTVVVSGEVLMQAGRILAFNEDRILDEAREAADRWSRQIRPVLEASGQMFDPFIHRILERVRVDITNEAR